MKKHLEPGAIVRLTENLHGIITKLTKDRAHITWKKTRGKGTVVREAARAFPLEEIQLSDDADAALGIGWRLQYFIQDGRGEALALNRSKASATSRKLWTPYSP